MINYAIIGTSWISKAFFDGAELTEKFNLAAVYSRNAEKAIDFAEQCHASGCKIYTSLDELANDGEINAVYIASPNIFHFKQSSLMLSHGKHVICEKPVALSRSQADELAGIADKNGVIFMEAIMMMHMPMLAKLSDAVLKIGRIYSAKFDFCQLSSKYAAYKAGQLPNIFNPDFATGCLMDLGIYCIYPALYLFGKPDSFSAQSLMLPEGADALGYCNLVYPDKHVLLSYSKVGQDRLGSEIMGDKGSVIIKSISTMDGMKIIYADGSCEEINVSTEKAVLMSYEAEDFFRYITDRDTREEYLNCRSLCSDVAELLQKIRSECGMRF